MRWMVAGIVFVGCGRPGIAVEEVEPHETGGAISETECELEAVITGESEVEDPEAVCVVGTCECANGVALAVWTLDDSPCYSDLARLGSLWERDGEVCFTPDVGGPYIVTVTCTDMSTSSPPTSFEVTVLPWDGPPELTVDCPTRGRVGEPVPLSAVFDCDEGPYSYFWELQERPDGSSSWNDSFGEQGFSENTFTGDVPGEYVISVGQYDGGSWSAPALCSFVLE